jgi:GxxExxY protein
MPFDAATPISDLTRRIIAAAIDVHRELGPGLLESAYQACLEYQLREQGLRFVRQLGLPLQFHGVYVDCGYRVDLLVEDLVIVEVKSVERLAPIHKAQMITYLKLTGCPVGLLMNFNVPAMRQGIRRLEKPMERVREEATRTTGDPDSTRRSNDDYDPHAP